MLQFRYMESRGSRYTLVIRRVQSEDYANYSCYASNKLGRGKAYVTLRGAKVVVLLWDIQGPFVSRTQGSRYLLGERSL